MSAQSGPGTPLVPSYPEWVKWTRNANVINVETVRQWMKPAAQWQPIFRATSLVWDGSERDGHLCPDSTRIARSVVDPVTKRASVRICLRTLDLYREFSRALLYVSLASNPDHGLPRLARTLGAYIDYLHEVAKHDQLAIHGSEYRSFCTVEYFTFLHLLDSDKAPACAEGAITKAYGPQFQSALQTAFFLPPKLVALLRSQTNRTTKEVAEAMIGEHASDNWWRLWKFPILHEVGHLASCHLGSFEGFSCTTRSRDIRELHQPGSRLEVEADDWAIKIILAAHPNDPDEVLGDLQPAVIFQIMSSLGFADGPNSSLQGRMASITEQMRKTWQLVLASPDLSADQRKLLKEFVEASMK